MHDELTFCIPVRIDSQKRIENLFSSIEYICRNSACQILVIEADGSSKVDISSFSDQVIYRFIKDENPIFHRTHYINLMLKSVKTKYAAIWDADIIVDITQIENALKLISPSSPLVLPYNGICYNVPDYIAEKFRRDINISLFYKYTDLLNIMNPYRVVGGAFIVDVMEYKNLGWENEHFIGWGPEDAERVRRLFILGKKVRQVDGVMFHLSHPKTSVGTDAERLAYITRQEFCKVCRMRYDELVNYIKTWKWICD